jgi:hypothetical protein
MSHAGALSVVYVTSNNQVEVWFVCHYALTPIYEKTPAIYYLRFSNGKPSLKAPRKEELTLRHSFAPGNSPFEAFEGVFCPNSCSSSTSDLRRVGRPRS